MKLLIKKAVSMSVAVCLVVAIANIPVYAKVNAISATKTTDAILSKTYVTPSQTVKEAKSSVKSTAKPAATKTTAKKATKKTVSLTTKIVKKYTKKGLQALKALANRLGLKLKTVYNQFVKYEVTKQDMKKVAPTLIKLVKRGVSFTCCVSLAVSKYLGISNNFSAIQCLASDIAVSARDFVTNSLNAKVIGYASSGTVLQKNGKKTEYFEVSLKDFMNNLKKGQKSLLHVTCLNGKGEPIDGHAITVVREKNGKYGVYDILTNGGNKITYTATEFKKFLNGKSAKGKTSYGTSIIKPVYYNSASGFVKYDFKHSDGKIAVTTDSKNIRQIVIKRSDEYKTATKINASIDKLLKNKGLNNLQKTWLKKAKNAVTNTINGPKGLYEKRLILEDTKNLIATVIKQNASILSLVKVSFDPVKGGWSGQNIFSSLKTVLKDNLTYKIYAKYGEEGINLISAISKKYNVSQNAIYSAFVNSGVTKTKMDDNAYLLIYQIERGEDIFNSSWINDKNVKNALLTIKTSVDKINNTNNNTNNNNNMTITDKINAKYGEKGINLVNKLSGEFNLDKETVYNQFVNSGVTKDQMEIVSGLIIKDIEKGYDIFNTGWGSDYSNVGDALAEIKKLLDK